MMMCSHTVDLSKATASTSYDRIEAVVFSQPSEGTGSTVPYADSSALDFYAKEFSDELKLYADPGDDLLIVSNGEFGTTPGQFTAFLYVEDNGANGIDQEISANEFTLLASFESDGNIIPEHFILG
jgi:hypothetical protein